MKRAREEYVNKPIKRELAAETRTPDKDYKLSSAQVGG